MKFFVLFLIFSPITIIYAQQPTIAWSKVYGQPSSATGLDIKPTIDGNYIVLNKVNAIDTSLPCNKGGTDIWLFKMDPLGDMLWQRCYGGSGSEGGGLSRIEPTLDGGYIFETETTSNDGDVSGNHGGQDVWVVKLDSVGNIMWQRCFGGGSTEYPFSLIATLDTGCIFVAATNSPVGGDIPFRYGGSFDDDAWVVKLDKNGEIVLNQIYGGTGVDLIWDLAELGSFIYLFGNTNSTDGNLSGLNVNGDDGWMMKADSNGELLWTKIYGQNNSEGFKHVIYSSDSFVVGGYATDLQTTIEHGYYHGGIDYWVMKMDINGNKVWQGEYGGTYNESFIAIYEAPFESGYYLIGSSNSNDGDITNHHGQAGLGSQANDYWIVKISLTGELIWEISLGGTQLDVCLAMSVWPISGIVVGITQSKDSDVYNPFFPNSQTWIVNLTDFNAIQEISNNKKSIKIVPHPIRERASIVVSEDLRLKARELQLLSLNGTLLHSYAVNGSDIQIRLNFPAGVYLYRITDDIGRMLASGDLVIQ